MPRYLNHYTCPRCNHDWQDEWSCMVDDECPNCGTRNISPVDADELDDEDDTDDDE